MQQENPNAAASRDGLPTPTVEQLHAMITELHGQLNVTRNELLATQSELSSTRAQLTSARGGMDRVTQSTSAAPKRNKPPTFDGRGSVDSWLEHIFEYCSAAPEDQKLSIAVTYLLGSAHEWYIGTKLLSDSPVSTFEGFCKAISGRFNPVDKVRAARDKLAKWRQVKSVHLYSQSFLEIVLDIPSITEDEKIDRYARGLKPYIWEELCTVNYNSLNELMSDAERVESAKSRSRRMAFSTPGVSRGPIDTAPAPMELGAIRLRKLTPEDRERCFRLGLCLRCRKPGHLAKDCTQVSQNPNENEAEGSSKN